MAEVRLDVRAGS